jgi:DNA-nicking Smr family endonuclease
MTKPSGTGRLKSFADLQRLLETKDHSSSSKKTGRAASVLRKRSPQDDFLAASSLESAKGVADRDLFRTVLQDVVPLEAGTGKRRRKKQKQKKTDLNREGMEALRTLVEEGKGFTVSNTPEYMEGRGYGVSSLLARRLHQGDFSIQAHVDLHGYSAQEACQAVDAFLDTSIRCGKRAVLIIHGRGLSSPDRPVLKEKVREWLSTGRWRKWVLAFTSARAEDGGAGATYVLLRKKPVTKSQRRGLCFIS